MRPRQDPDRKLAWVNSICILFLLIGIVGSRPASIRIKPLPPMEEVSAAIVEPLPPPPQAQSEPQKQEQQNDQEQPDTPQVVVVTLETPAINFSVPTIGNLLVPNAIAQAPPLAPLKQPVAPAAQPCPRCSTPPAAAASGRNRRIPRSPWNRASRGR